MELHDLFNKWKLNRNLFASFLGIHKGSFNNKINPKYPGILRREEKEIIKQKFIEMKEDLNSYINQYPEIEEDLNGTVDEKITYGGKEF